MKLDPKHLMQLSMIVESGSFQSAADRMGLTQPALSRNMRALEQRLGCPLFQRDGRRSVPTPVGFRLARNGLAIRNAEEQASVVAAQAYQGAVGELRIGAPPIVAGKFITNTLSQFIKENPDCSIELRSGLVHELRTMLERGQIDLLIGPQMLSGTDDELQFTILLEDYIGILCHKNHPLAQKDQILISDLKAQKWLMPSRGSVLRQQAELAMVSSGLTALDIGCETDSIRSALEIIAQTNLITPAPIAPISPYLEDRLVFLNFRHPQFYRPIGAMRRRSVLINHVEDKFLMQLQKSLARPR